MKLPSLTLETEKKIIIDKFFEVANFKSAGNFVEREVNEEI
ncbi:MAG: hypothetical protein ACI9YE_001240 [Psychroserpens sp.]|jgi:hypothetical protein